MDKEFIPTKFMLPTSYYDNNKAEYVISFIENLKHTKGEWYNKPFILLPWQKEIIRNLFGVIKEDGYRQFTTGYVEVPKKQGKTELGAAIALYMLLADGEWGAEVYSCAADRAQASLIYQVAVDMIGLSPALRKRLKKEVVEALKDIGIPVSFQTSKENKYPYITFFTYLDRTMQHADDGELITGYFIQIDIWSKTDYTSMEEKVHREMIKSGFLKQRFHDLYEDDIKVYHKVMRFFKEVKK